MVLGGWQRNDCNEVMMLEWDDDGMISFFSAQNLYLLHFSEHLSCIMTKANAVSALVVSALIAYAGRSALVLPHIIERGICHT